MSWWQSRLESWKQDRILRLLLKNTGYMFSGTGLSLFLSMVVSIFVAQILEVRAFGLVGIITTYASTVNRLFSFRMSELVVKYMGGYLTEGRKDRAAAIVKISMLTEAVTSVLAFICLILLSPLAAHYLAKNDGTLVLFYIYGISVLGNLVTETSTGVLQVIHRFREQAVINAAQSILTTAIIFAALFFRQNSQMVLWDILLGYLVGKMVLGIAPVVIALRSLDESLGKGWGAAPFNLLPPFKELARFAISTNMSATLNMVVRDSELLWISFFLSPVEAGYYKVALAIINLISIPINPFTSTTYPQITRYVTEKSWKKLRLLLWRVTLITTAITASTILGLGLFGHFVLYLYGNGSKYLPAYPILMILLVGYGIANILFWNRPLLLALNRPEAPFRVGFYTGLVKVVSSLWIIPIFGVVGAASLLSGYLGISVCLIVITGFIALNGLQKKAAMEVEPA
jgi:O-antigen/teichoic acid export membrane protein